MKPEYRILTIQYKNMPVKMNAQMNKSVKKRINKCNNETQSSSLFGNMSCKIIKAEIKMKSKEIFNIRQL